MGMCGPATRTAMSGSGASPLTTLSARPSKPCTPTSGAIDLHLQSKAMKSCTTCCCSKLNEVLWHCVILIAHCSNSLSGSQIG